MSTDAPKFCLETLADGPFMTWVQESQASAAYSVRFIAACLLCWPNPRAVPYQMLYDVIKEAREVWQRSNVPAPSLTSYRRRISLCAIPLEAP